jgi:hypothetical protein
MLPNWVWGYRKGPGAKGFRWLLATVESKMLACPLEAPEEYKLDDT